MGRVVGPINWFISMMEKKCWDRDIGVSGHRGDSIRPLNTTVLWWSEGFQGEGASIVPPWCREMPVSRAPPAALSHIFRFWYTFRFLRQNSYLMETITKRNISHKKYFTLGIDKKVFVPLELHAEKCNFRVLLECTEFDCGIGKL